MKIVATLLASLLLCASCTTSYSGLSFQDIDRASPKQKGMGYFAVTVEQDYRSDVPNLFWFLHLKSVTTDKPIDVEIFLPSASKGSSSDNSHRIAYLTSIPADRYKVVSTEVRINQQMTSRTEGVTAFNQTFPVDRAFGEFVIAEGEVRHIFIGSILMAIDLKNPRIELAAPNIRFAPPQRNSVWAPYAKPLEGFKASYLYQSEVGLEFKPWDLSAR